MIERLDTMLFSGFEWFAHWTQRSVGLTSYTLARFCVLLMGLICIGHVYNWFHPFLVMPSYWFDIVIGGVFVPSYLWVAASLDAADRDANDTVPLTILNQRVAMSIGFRLFFATSAVFVCTPILVHYALTVRPFGVLLINSFSVSFGFWFTCYAYFIWVNPLPTARVRVLIPSEVG